MSRYIVYDGDEPFAWIIAVNADGAVIEACRATDGHLAENCIAREITVYPGKWVDE